MEIKQNGSRGSSSNQGQQHTRTVTIETPLIIFHLKNTMHKGLHVLEIQAKVLTRVGETNPYEDVKRAFTASHIVCCFKHSSSML